MLRSADDLFASCYGTTFLTALVLAGPGLGWSAWRYAQLAKARASDPDEQHQTAYDAWSQRAAGYEQAELSRLDGLPEWGSAESLHGAPTCSAARWPGGGHC
jgi:hypothetical protein